MPTPHFFVACSYCLIRHSLHHNPGVGRLSIIVFNYQIANPAKTEIRLFNIVDKSWVLVKPCKYGRPDSGHLAKCKKTKIHSLQCGEDRPLYFFQFIKTNFHWRFFEKHWHITCSPFFKINFLTI